MYSRQYNILCQQRPEAIVVSGDLTQRARFKQFYDVPQFLDSLISHILLCRVIMIFRLYHVWNRFFLHLYVISIFWPFRTTLETEHFYIVGVNSIRRRYHTRGHISLEQIHETDKLKNAPQIK
jgi:hypothetical protein